MELTEIKAFFGAQIDIEVGYDLDIALHKSAKVISMTCLNASSKGS